MASRMIGRPDPVHTEVVVAYIVRKNATQNLNGLADELRVLCRQHLAPYEVPAIFEFTDQVPRSPLGKLLKNRLRALSLEKPKSPNPVITNEKEAA